MAVRVLSSEFSYTDILAKYDTNAIASSVIKYFQALQQWTDELMTLIENYEREKLDTISQFNTITLTLSKIYTDSPDLTVKAKLLAVKAQADALEDRIDSTDSITELAAISREDRATFPLIAENTARILMNALVRIDHFEAHREFVVNAVKTLTDWAEDYRVFRTSRRSTRQQ